MLSDNLAELVFGLIISSPFPFMLYYQYLYHLLRTHQLLQFAPVAVKFVLSLSNLRSQSDVALSFNFLQQCLKIVHSLCLDELISYYCSPWCWY